MTYAIVVHFVINVCTVLFLLFQAPPGPPLNLISTDITFINMTLSWDQPSDLGGRTEIYYTIAYNNAVISLINSTHYTLTDLLPDTEYLLSVTAENDVSNQDNSSIARTITMSFSTLPVPSGESLSLNV